MPLDSMNIAKTGSPPSMCPRLSSQFLKPLGTHMLLQLAE